MREGRDEEKKEMGNKWKIMMLIVATNVVASRPPKHRPTGTLHAHANCQNPNRSVKTMPLLANQ